MLYRVLNINLEQASTIDLYIIANGIPDVISKTHCSADTIDPLLFIF